MSGGLHDPIAMTPAGSVEATMWAAHIRRATEPWLRVCPACGDDVHFASLGGKSGLICAACRLDGEAGRL